ncbi:MAG: hypothetical protein PVJ34_18025 [Anaerolineae bacterium]|jgi:hypothetical protein
MKIFIAGIMQGSRLDEAIDDQDYRAVIAGAIQARYPGVEIVDPNLLHPDGVDYEDDLAHATLIEMAELAGRCDLVVAYAPQASMGTALEMWEAYRHGVPVVTISPMAANWVVRHLSTRVLPDLAAFARWIADGELDKLVNLD